MGCQEAWEVVRDELGGRIYLYHGELWVGVPWWWGIFVWVTSSHRAWDEGLHTDSLVWKANENKSGEWVRKNNEGGKPLQYILELDCEQLGRKPTMTSWGRMYLRIVHRKKEHLSISINSLRPACEFQVGSQRCRTQQHQKIFAQKARNAFSARGEKVPGYPCTLGLP